jgi:CRISPR/Cas system CSM-associated protein Csm3 (group 7 of RAMP superfamily)
MSTNRDFIVANVSIYSVQPLTFTHHGVDGLPMMTRGVDQDGRHQRTVYIPAAQFRGRIRHEAALSEMRGKAEKVKLEEAYLLALGQDLRPDEEDEPEQVRLKDQLKFRAAHPLLDLFGTWKISSRLYVSHFLPDANVMPDKVSHIRRDMDTNEEMMAELEDVQQDRLYERQDKQGLASKAGTLIKLATRELMMAKKAKDTAKVYELEAKLQAIKELKKTHKDGDESDNTKHLLVLEVIPAGITLNGKLTVHCPSPYDLKTLVNALDSLSFKPYLGAQRARGCGEVRGTASFKNQNDDVLVAVAFGGLSAAKVEWTNAGKQFLNSADKVAA